MPCPAGTLWPKETPGCMCTKNCKGRLYTAFIWPFLSLCWNTSTSWWHSRSKMYVVSNLAASRSNSMIHFSIQCIKIKVYVGKKEFLKIFTNYWLQEHSPIGLWTTGPIVSKITKIESIKAIDFRLIHLMNFLNTCSSLKKQFFNWCKDSQGTFRLYIPSKSTQRFVDVIGPYIHYCFDYKIQNH